MLAEKQFSTEYAVRRLRKNDVDRVLRLCVNNELYYQYCPPMVSRETICEEMAELPPGMGPESKYYVGYFDGERMIALLDLIEGYPEKDIAFIGLFMTEKEIQNRGVGTGIITQVLEYLKTSGFRAVRLAWVKGNPQSEHFWLKNGFSVIRETTSTAAESVILAERLL